MSWFVRFPCFFFLSFAKKKTFHRYFWKDRRNCTIFQQTVEDYRGCFDTGWIITWLLIMFMINVAFAWFELNLVHLSGVPPPGQPAELLQITCQNRHFVNIWNDSWFRVYVTQACVTKNRRHNATYISVEIQRYETQGRSCWYLDHHNKSSAMFLYNNITILSLDSRKDAIILRMKEKIPWKLDRRLHNHKELQAWWVDDGVLYSQVVLSSFLFLSAAKK